jgi:hypothetical protein
MVSDPSKLSKCAHPPNTDCSTLVPVCVCVCVHVCVCVCVARVCACSIHVLKQVG